MVADRAHREACQVSKPTDCGGSLDLEELDEPSAGRVMEGDQDVEEVAARFTAWRSRWCRGAVSFSGCLARHVASMTSVSSSYKVVCITSGERSADRDEVDEALGEVVARLRPQHDRLRVEIDPTLTALLAFTDPVEDSTCQLFDSRPVVHQRLQARHHCPVSGCLGAFPAWPAHGATDALFLGSRHPAIRSSPWNERGPRGPRSRGPARPGDQAGSPIVVLTPARLPSRHHVPSGQPVGCPGLRWSGIERRQGL